MTAMIVGYFAIVGSLCLALSGWLFLRRLWVMLDGVTTTGAITGYQMRDIDESKCYLPIVSFTDAQGQTHSFTSVAGGRSKRPRPGSTIRVRYPAATPASPSSIMSYTCGAARSACLSSALPVGCLIGSDESNLIS